MKNYFIILTTMFLGVISTHAQSIERQVISSYGQLTPTSSATVGEVISETKSISGSFTLNQGFQQADEQTETGIKNVDLHVNYTLYPNPATDYLNVSVETDLSVNLKLYIINALGQKVSEIKEFEINNKVDMQYNTENFASGTYYLIIESATGKQQKNIPFIKD